MFSNIQGQTQHSIILICTYKAQIVYDIHPPYWHIADIYSNICVSFCCLKKKKKNSVSKLFLNYLTLRNVHFSDDCALIASYSAQVDCLYNMSLYSVSPSAMSRLLCITPVSFEKCLLSHQLSLLYGGAGRENTCLWLHVTTSCVFQSLPVTPHCFPLLCSQQYLWEHLCINFLLDYRSHAKDNLA